MVRAVTDKNKADYFVVNLDTKEVLRGVQWANDETGYYHKYKLDKKGDVIRKFCKITKSYETVIEEKKGNIAFIKTNGILVEKM